MASRIAGMPIVSWWINGCYLLLLAVTSPWWLYRMLVRGKYRRGWREKLLGAVPPPPTGGRVVWLHAVSVGEVNVLAPLIEALEQRFEDLVFCITTTTDTGYEVARQRYARHCVCYAPFDFSWAVGRVLRRWRPAVIVLAELELWPNWVRLAHRADVPLVVVNGRLSDSSFRGYRRWRWLLGGMFRRLSVVGAQSDDYAARFAELGVPRDRVVTTGSLKFDGAQTDRDNAKTRALATWAGITGEHVVFLAGSTQEPEERLALEAFRLLRRDHPQLRLVLVPRHPQRFGDVARLLDASGLDWARRSRDVRGDRPIILVDTMGELGAWWGTAHIAYVGGTMGSREGQNMIEPAAYGAALAFGPRTRNFRDVVALLRAEQAAVVVHDQDELIQFVRRALEDESWCRELGQRAQRVVLRQLGAVEKTISLLEPHLKRDSVHRVDGGRSIGGSLRPGSVCVKQ